VFERYTEKARRVIFFARYEASQYGSPYIETEHLLLGLMREDKALANRFLRQQGSIESIRKEIEARITIRERISTSVEVPLSAECKRILNMAGEEAERLGVTSYTLSSALVPRKVRWMPPTFLSPLYPVAKFSASAQPPLANIANPSKRIVLSSAASNP
jgi:ATP-dependent Clp protease ATP-binding subunit ClpA